MVTIYGDSVSISTPKENSKEIQYTEAFLKAKTDEINFEIFAKKVCFVVTTIGAVILLIIGKIMFFQGLDGIISFLEFLT